MFFRAAFCLLFLTAAPAALAQETDAPPAPAAPVVEAPPPAPEPEEAIKLLPGAPDPLVNAPRQQVFISPSGEPFRAAPGEPYPVAGWFARADANRDGTLTAEEFAADHLAFFKTLDKDADGIVDGFEAAAYETDIAPEVAVREPARRRPRPRTLFGFGRRANADAPGRHGAALYGLINEPLPIRAADADFDYKVTTAEATAAAARRFALLDRDGNGRLALAELPRTPLQIRLARDKDRKPSPGGGEARLQPSARHAIPEA